MNESFYYLCLRIKRAVLTASGGSRLHFQLQLFFPGKENGHLAVIQDRDNWQQLCENGVTCTFCGRPGNYPGGEQLHVRKAQDRVSGSWWWSVGSRGLHRVNLTAESELRPPEGSQTASAGASCELGHPGVCLLLRTAAGAAAAPQPELQALFSSYKALLHHLSKLCCMRKTPCLKVSSVANRDLAFLQLLLPSSLYSVQHSVPFTASMAAWRNCSKMLM